MYFAEHWKIGTIAAELGVHRVERRIRDLRESFFAARAFGSLEDRPKRRSQRRARRQRRALHLRRTAPASQHARSSAGSSTTPKSDCSSSTKSAFSPSTTETETSCSRVISRRYEKKNTVLTTYLAFRDWPTIFPNATCATALIDRVVHHADVIAIEGESYRAREADAQAKARRARRKEQPGPDTAA